MGPTLSLHAVMRCSLFHGLCTARRGGGVMATPLSFLHHEAGAPWTHCTPQHLVLAVDAHWTGPVVTLQRPLLLGPPVLEPNLNHTHIQSSLSRDLFSSVPGGLWGLHVALAKYFQLLGSDSSARSLLVAICRAGEHSTGVNNAATAS